MTMQSPDQRRASSLVAGLFEKHRTERERTNNLMFLAKVMHITEESKTATISFNGGKQVVTGVLYVAPAPVVDDVVIVTRLGGYIQSTHVILGKIEVPDVESTGQEGNQ